MGSNKAKMKDGKGRQTVSHFPFDKWVWVGTRVVKWALALLSGSPWTNNGLPAKLFLMKPSSDFSLDLAVVDLLGQS